MSASVFGRMRRGPFTCRIRTEWDQLGNFDESDQSILIGSVRICEKFSHHWATVKCRSARYILVITLFDLWLSRSSPRIEAAAVAILSVPRNLTS